MARLLLFGPAREIAGVARVVLPGQSVSGVIAAAEERFGKAFADIVAISNVWLNGDVASGATPVSDEDEVAVIPPVSGVSDMGENRSGSGLTHIDDRGRARMVDVTGKPLTRRVAMAKCVVVTSIDTQHVVLASSEGIDVLEAARFAGIQAAKRTASLIPLCHPIRIDGVSVDVTVGPRRFDVSAVTEIVERTGVEMEALTACAVAALTLVQAVVEDDPTASIEDLTLWHKSGGRSGNWERTGPDARMTHREEPTGRTSATASTPEQQDQSEHDDDR